MISVVVSHLGHDVRQAQVTQDARDHRHTGAASAPPTCDSGHAQRRCGRRQQPGRRQPGAPGRPLGSAREMAPQPPGRPREYDDGCGNRSNVQGDLRMQGLYSRPDCPWPCRPRTVLPSASASDPTPLDGAIPDDVAPKAVVERNHVGIGILEESDDDRRLSGVGRVAVRPADKFTPGDAYDPERFVNPAGFQEAVTGLERMYLAQVAKERAGK